MAKKTSKHYNKGGMKKPGFKLDIGEINKDIAELEKELTKRKTPIDIINKRIERQIEGIRMRNERIRTGKTRSKNPFVTGKTRPPSPGTRKYSKRSSIVYSHSRKSRDSKGSKTRSATRTH